MNRRLNGSINKQEGLSMLNLPNCVSLSENGGCILLKLKKCQGLKCSFMKSNEELESMNKHWEERLSGLDEEKQVRISKLYYGGKMPWLDLED
jgi:hypothetical protein